VLKTNDDLRDHQQRMHFYLLFLHSFPKMLMFPFIVQPSEAAEVRSGTALFERNVKALQEVIELQGQHMRNQINVLKEATRLTNAQSQLIVSQQELLVVMFEIIVKCVRFILCLSIALVSVSFLLASKSSHTGSSYASHNSTPFPGLLVGLVWRIVGTPFLAIIMHYLLLSNNLVPVSYHALFLENKVWVEIVALAVFDLMHREIVVGFLARSALFSLIFDLLQGWAYFFYSHIMSRPPVSVGRDDFLSKVEDWFEEAERQSRARKT
jgi:hypothetical protein